MRELPVGQERQEGRRSYIDALMRDRPTRRKFKTDAQLNSRGQDLGSEDDLIRLFVDCHATSIDRISHSSKRLQIFDDQRGATKERKEYDPRDQESHSGPISSISPNIGQEQRERPNQTYIGFHSRSYAPQHENEVVDHRQCGDESP